MPTEKPAESEPSTNIAEYSVSGLSNALKRTVEETYGYVRVRGELGRISRPGSGHIYLDMKDDKAVLGGVIWRGVAAKLRFQPEQGLEVIVTGRLTTYPGQSKYQIVIESMEPAGVGALMALLEERRKKLAAEGLFDEERKKQLPYLPDVIGVVTSPSGAVIRDILHRLSDRFPRHVLVWPVRVQGETSAEEVAAGIAGFNALEVNGKIPRPDLLIVARGGGSLEDLWGFNEEIVVRAAAASEIPLISAIGHETDWTLLDQVADVRAPTPTAAAEMAVPIRSELVATLDDLARRRTRAQLRLFEDRRAALRSATRGLPRLTELLALPRQRLDMAAGRIGQALQVCLTRRRSDLTLAASRLSARLLRERLIRERAKLEDYALRGKGALRALTQHGRAHFNLVVGRLSPKHLVESVQRNIVQIDNLDQRLSRGFARSIETRRLHLENVSKLLSSLSYQGVLSRGFALVRDRDGNMVRSQAVLAPAMGIEIEFADGRVAAQVTKGGKSVKKTVKSAGKKMKTDRDQGSLF